MVTINEQVFLFLTCLQTGVIMGMLYDLIRIFRKIVHHPNWMVQIEDLLYWVTCGCFAFIMLYWENYGQIRIFVFAGILIGSVLYFLTFSILFMKVATWVIFWTKKIINQLIQFVLIPIKCIIRILDIPYQYICRTYHTLNRYKQMQVRKAKIKGKKYKGKNKSKKKEHTTDNIHERGNTVKKNKKDKTVSMKITMFIVTMILVTLGYQGIRLRHVSQQLDQQLKKTQKEIAIESKKLEDLEKEYQQIDSLQNIEKVARDKLGLVKNDEIVFKIP